ncbi:MAG: hypothetical protein C1O27_002595 [Chloroflexi bacterium]|nr:MAG: hypothetical protein C1O27_002595 [Chloroflexota bacterium]
MVQNIEAVLTKRLEWFKESRGRHLEALTGAIAWAMAENSVGVPIIIPAPEVNVAVDIEAAYVVRPVLDQVNRWMREHHVDVGAADEQSPTDFTPADTPDLARPC